MCMCLYMRLHLCVYIYKYRYMFAYIHAHVYVYVQARLALTSHQHKRIQQKNSATTLLVLDVLEHPANLFNTSIQQKHLAQCASDSSKSLQQKCSAKTYCWMRVSAAYRNIPHKYSASVLLNALALPAERFLDALCVRYMYLHLSVCIYKYAYMYTYPHTLRT